MKRKSLMATLSLCVVFSGMMQANAQSNATIELSQNNWSLWLDTAAKWQQDKLYAPPVKLSDVPVNIPTGGWQSLDNNSKNGNSASSRLYVNNIHLPATVEEYFWALLIKNTFCMFAE